MRLTREQIDAVLNGEHTSCKLSIREVLEECRALMDENERLKKLDAANIVYMQGQVEENGTLKAENARLNGEISASRHIGNELADKCDNLERANARLREEVQNGTASMTQEKWAKEVKALRAVVEAAKNLKCGKETTSGTRVLRFVDHLDLCSLESALAALKEGE